MKLKEVDDRINKAKNSEELLALMGKVVKGGITGIDESKFKSDYSDIKDKSSIGLFFSKDGNRLYVVLGKEILELALSIPFDWRTGTYVGKIGWAI